MIILAKSVKGSEFLYNARTAHKVSKANAEKIRDVLNEYNYKLKDGETWFIHDVSETYDNAGAFASYQAFTMDKHGVVKEKFTRGY